MDKLILLLICATSLVYGIKTLDNTKVQSAKLKRTAWGFLPPSKSLSTTPCPPWMLENKIYQPEIQKVQFIQQQIYSTPAPIYAKQEQKIYAYDTIKQIDYQQEKQQQLIQKAVYQPQIYQPKIIKPLSYAYAPTFNKPMIKPYYNNYLVKPITPTTDCPPENQQQDIVYASNYPIKYEQPEYLKQIKPIQKIQHVAPIYLPTPKYISKIPEWIGATKKMCD